MLQMAQALENDTLSHTHPASIEKAHERWLLKKGNPQGWICAQTRPAQGFLNVQEHYKNQNETFPDCESCYDVLQLSRLTSC
jgi:hypothetical protein